MAWRRPGDKPLSEPMVVYSLLAHICATQPQWVNVPWLYSVYIISMQHIITSECSWRATTDMHQHDALVVNRHSAISNNHVNSTITSVAWIKPRDTEVTSQLLNKQCSGEAGRSATIWFLCNWWVHLLTQIIRLMLRRHRIANMSYVLWKLTYLRRDMWRLFPGHIDSWYDTPSCQMTSPGVKETQ